MNRGELEPPLFVIDEDSQVHTTLPDEDPQQEASVASTSTTMKEAKTAKSAKKAKQYR